MKLIIAIVNSEDASAVLSELTGQGFSVTKLATSGGFLRAGNVTMMIGVEEERLQDVLDILKSCAGRREDTMYTVASSAPDAHCAGTAQAIPIPVETGGVTVFVMDLNSLEKF